MFHLFAIFLTSPSSPGSHKANSDLISPSFVSAVKRSGVPPTHCISCSLHNSLRARYYWPSWLYFLE